MQKAKKMPFHADNAGSNRAGYAKFSDINLLNLAASWARVLSQRAMQRASWRPPLNTKAHRVHNLCLRRIAAMPSVPFIPRELKKRSSDLA